MIEPAKLAGGEHWGGANDAKWHGPPRLLVLSLTAQSDAGKKQPVIQIASVAAEALLPVFKQSAAFKVDFEDPQLRLQSKQLEDPQSWSFQGNVKIDEGQGYISARSLLLSRTLEQVNDAVLVYSPRFPVSPGHWQLGVACKSDLHSPDNSYSGIVILDVYGRANDLLEQITVADEFGKQDWQAVEKRAELPAGAQQARFRILLAKTYGRFWVDDLSASHLAPPSLQDDRITRMLFATAQLGNLLFPDDPRTVSVTVETKKPLRDEQHQLTYVVRDYWGAEQTLPATVSLSVPEKKPHGYAYQATLDLAKAELEIGRYYELHALIPQRGDEPYRGYTSLAILPPAETHRYKPEEVPFTSRNWDNRITQYIKLSDRLGIRICGIWGGWSSKPPYKPESPNLDLCQQLGMGWLTTTPCASIERGKTDYDEAALRQGVRNLIEKYGHVRPLIINLGNEPHGTGERVLKNVAAYRVVYEEIKKVDSTIPVVATSVEPNEEYFKAGYGQWCDAYDFHIYEEFPNVRRTMNEYRALAKKYGVEKPIWSTELGLNSQGMTRHAVAVELIKKFTTFFAAGGQSVSWFGLLYPDAEGKQHGSSGDAHNVFDCRFNRYAPRLDAVAYYHAVNAIAIKKFVDEQQYEDGVSAYLFRDRDGQCLQVIWKARGRKDIGVPLPGVDTVQVIRIDGSRRALHAAKESITLTATEDPLLLLYQSEAKELPEKLISPLAELLPQEPQSGARAFFLSRPAVGVTSEVILPRDWKVSEGSAAKETTGKGLVHEVKLDEPNSTAAHAVDVTVVVRDAEKRPRGELYQRFPR